MPQPGANTSKIDALSIWPMGPLQYRNFGDHETLLFNHTVNIDGNGLAGIRWHELRRSPGDCFVLHDLSSRSAAELKERIHRFDAVVVLEPPAFPPGFVAGAPGFNRAHRFATESTLRDAGLSRAEGLPVEGLPPMTVYVRKPDHARHGASGGVTRLGQAVTPTVK